jgi:hypothetical protein
VKPGNCSRPSRQAVLRYAIAILPLTIPPLGTLTTLTACETEIQRSEHEDRVLATDGFKKEPADTPERREMLARLPVNHFVERVDGNAVFYVYSDPTACQCIYVGTQHAYDSYKADRQSVDVYSNDDPSLDWKVWGPWPSAN